MAWPARAVGCLAALSIIVATPPAPAETTAAGGVEARLGALRARRVAIIEDFAATVTVCVARKDTDHAAFRGCVDWHSAVHGTWALVRYTMLTGDRRYVALIESVLRPELVATERELLRRRPAFEMPYGRAWFLRLAIDYRAAFGSELLAPMADDVARTLVRHYQVSPPDPLARNYDSASWALMNLYDYGLSRGDRAIIDFVRRMVREHFRAADAVCPAARHDRAWPDFIAVCANWAWLVARVAPPSNLAGWLARLLGKGRALRPVTRLRTAHHAGLNFSRAWALWGLFAATGDRRWLALYLDHMEAQLAHPERWRGDYRRHAHWVAQFGVFALAPVFAARPEDRP